MNKNPWNDSEEENSDDFISADEDEVSCNYLVRDFDRVSEPTPEALKERLAPVPLNFEKLLRLQGFFKNCSCSKEF